MKPRSIGGGRSGRYEQRHDARGYARTNAPMWNDAAAEVLAELHKGSQAAGCKIVEHTGWVLGARERMAELVETLKGRLSKSDREVAAALMEEHRDRPE